jgi:hypothetical protein
MRHQQEVLPVARCLGYVWGTESIESGDDVRVKITNLVFMRCSLLIPWSLFLMISDQYFIFSERVESSARLSFASTSSA